MSNIWKLIAYGATVDRFVLLVLQVCKHSTSPLVLSSKLCRM